MTRVEKLLTVVIVSYEGAHLLPACLDALDRQTLSPDRYEIWVVDNGSSDGTASLLAGRYPTVRRLDARRNLGFAGGNNLALREVATPFVVLLNNDAVADADFLRAMVDAMTSPGWEQVGAATAQILLLGRFDRIADGELVPDPHGDVVVLNSTGNEVRSDGFGQDRDWFVDVRCHRPTTEVFGFCGAAATLRTEALRDVGVFDDDYFLYYEDTDLSWRLRLANWEIRYVDRAIVHHVHAASSREGSAFFRFYDDRNRLLTLVKNAPAALALRAVLRYPLSLASIAARGREQPSLTFVRLRVLASFLRLLPRMLSRRRHFSRKDRRRVAALLVEPPAIPTRAYRT